MGRPSSYSDTQVSAVKALLALRPRIGATKIAAVTGVKYGTVRFYEKGLAKTETMAPWGTEIVKAMEHAAKNQPQVAAYYLVSAAKLLLNK